MLSTSRSGLFFQFRLETEKDNKNPENPVNPVKKIGMHILHQ